MTQHTEAGVRLSIESDPGSASAAQDAKSSLADVAEAARDAGSAAGDLDQLGTSARSAGDVVEQSMGGAADAIRDAREELSDPIELNLDRARQEMKGLVTEVERGTEDVSGEIGRVLLSFEDLQKEIRETKRSGGGMTDAQERELRELERQLEETIQAQGRFRSAINEADRRVQSASGGVSGYAGSLGLIDAQLAATNPKLLKLSGTVGAVGAGLSAGHSAGQGFLRLLGDIDAALGTSLLPSLNSFTQEFFQMEEIAQGILDLTQGARDGASADADELRNILQQLRAEGIEPVSDSLPELRDQLQQVREGQGEVARGATELQQQSAEWVDSIGLNVGALKDQASALAANISIYEETGSALDKAVVADKIKPEVQAVLDAFEELGLRAPADLQRVADTYGIVSSSAEAHAQRVAAATQRMTESIGQAISGLPGDLETSAKAAQEAIGKLDYEQINRLSLEQKDNVRGNVEQMLEAMRAGNVGIDSHAQGIAAAVGIAVAGFEPIGQAAQEVEAPLRSVQDVLGQTAESSRQQAAHQQALDLALRNTAAAAGDYEGAARTQADAARAVGEATGASADAQRRAEQSTTGAAAAHREAAAATEQEAAAAGSALAEVEALLAASDRRSAAASGAADASQRAAQASQEEGAAAKEAATGLDEQAAAAERVASSAERAGETAAAIVELGRASAGSATQISDGAEDIQDAIDSLLEEASRLKEGIATAFAIPPFAEPIIAQIHLIRDAAKEARREVEALEGGDLTSEPGADTEAVAA
ncbi:MAG: hypothetical protein AAGN46_13790 [Acidobacteriota bacterium]